MRTACERCEKPLAPDGDAAVICSYECTFCASARHAMEERLPELRRRARRAPAESRVVSGHVRHLYVHLPFCAHRCGYCDFVTVVGRGGQHAAYVDALLRELELERASLADEVETIFLGGGTPTFTALPELLRVLEALPAAEEVTVEANPETVTAELAAALRSAGVTRVSLGAQTFQPELLRVLERVAGPDDVRRAVHHLRDAGFDNISLDLIYGIPGQSPADLDADLDDALALEPEHLSCYELEAKPGTRFTHAWGAELERQAEALEDYFERVVARLTGAGYRWYETANFCRPDGRAGPPLAAQPGLLARPRLPRARDRRGQHNREGAGGTRRVSGATSAHSRRVACRTAKSSTSTTTFSRASA